MRIYSAPSYTSLSGEVPYDVNLPQVQKEFWTAGRKIDEAAYLATAIAPAGVFRQLTKYDVSGISKAFSIVLTAAQATTLQAMEASTQTEWHLNTGTAVYLVMLRMVFSYVSGTPSVSIAVSVLGTV